MTAEEGEVVEENGSNVAAETLTSCEAVAKELSVTEYLNSEDIPMNGDAAYEELTQSRTEAVPTES